MGYDLYWVRVPADLAARAELALAAAEEVSKRADADPQTRDAAWEAYQRAQPYYFRLGNWGMGLRCDLMLEFGMVVPSAVRPEDWPQPEQFGTTVEKVTTECLDAGGGMRKPTSPAVAAFLRARHRFLREHLAERPGIPLHKLCSNDGWVVTPADLRDALRVAPEVASYEAEDGIRKPLDRWIAWLEFLRGGGTHGGIEVW